MDYLIISIGQAGNQINFELSNLLLNNDNINSSLIYPNNPNTNILNTNFSKTFQGDLAKSILIDSEQKVVKKFTDKNFNKNWSLYKEGVNLITNSSGRGNNWALGYSLEYKEPKKINKFFNLEEDNKNISLESFELINKFLEKCDFIKGFLSIHSLNGGTGSGVTTRVIEMLREEFPKFNFVDCPVVGMDSKKYKKYIKN